MKTGLKSNHHPGSIFRGNDKSRTILLQFSPSWIESQFLLQSNSKPSFYIPPRLLETGVNCALRSPTVLAINGSKEKLNNALLYLISVHNGSNSADFSLVLLIPHSAKQSLIGPDGIYHRLLTHYYNATFSIKDDPQYLNEGLYLGVLPMVDVFDIDHVLLREGSFIPVTIETRSAQNLASLLLDLESFGGVFLYTRAQERKLKKELQDERMMNRCLSEQLIALQKTMGIERKSDGTATTDAPVDPSMYTAGSNMPYPSYPPYWFSMPFMPSGGMGAGFAPSNPRVFSNLMASVASPPPPPPVYPSQMPTNTASPPIAPAAPKGPTSPKDSVVVIRKTDGSLIQIKKNTSSTTHTSPNQPPPPPHHLASLSPLSSPSTSHVVSPLSSAIHTTFSTSTVPRISPPNSSAEVTSRKNRTFATCHSTPQYHHGERARSNFPDVCSIDRLVHKKGQGKAAVVSPKRMKADARGPEVEEEKKSKRKRKKRAGNTLSHESNASMGKEELKEGKTGKDAAGYHPSNLLIVAKQTGPAIDDLITPPPGLNFPSKEEKERLLANSIRTPHNTPGLPSDNSQQQIQWNQTPSSSTVKYRRQITPPLSSDVEAAVISIERVKSLALEKCKRGTGNGILSNGVVETPGVSPVLANLRHNWRQGEDDKVSQHSNEVIPEEVEEKKSPSNVIPTLPPLPSLSSLPLHPSPMNVDASAPLTQDKSHPHPPSNVIISSDLSEWESERSLDENIYQDYLQQEKEHPKKYNGSPTLRSILQTERGRREFLADRESSLPLESDPVALPLSTISPGSSIKGMRKKGVGMEKRDVSSAANLSSTVKTDIEVRETASILPHKEKHIDTSAPVPSM